MPLVATMVDVGTTGLEEEGGLRANDAVSRWGGLTDLLAVGLAHRRKVARIHHIGMGVHAVIILDGVTFGVPVRVLWLSTENRAVEEAVDAAVPVGATSSEALLQKSTSPGATLSCEKSRS